MFLILIYFNFARCFLRIFKISFDLSAATVALKGRDQTRPAVLGRSWCSPATKSKLSLHSMRCFSMRQVRWPRTASSWDAKACQRERRGDPTAWCRCPASALRAFFWSCCYSNWRSSRELTLARCFSGDSWTTYLWGTCGRLSWCGHPASSSTPPPAMDSCSSIERSFPLSSWPPFPGVAARRQAAPERGAPLADSFPLSRRRFWSALWTNWSNWQRRACWLSAKLSSGWSSCSSSCPSWRPRWSRRTGTSAPSTPRSFRADWMLEKPARTSENWCWSCGWAPRRPASECSPPPDHCLRTRPPIECPRIFVGAPARPSS